MKKYIIVFYTVYNDLYYYDGDTANIECAIVIDNLSVASVMLISANKLCGEYYKYCEIREWIFNASNNN